MKRLPSSRIAGLAVVFLLSVTACAAFGATTPQGAKRGVNLGDSAQKLPPLGQRKYVLEERAAPVTIKSDDETPARPYLKDPISTAPDKARPQPQLVEKKKPRLPAARSAQLKFKHLPVSGKLTRPRVEFTSEVIPVGRADEPVRENFFPKVFDPALDYEF